MVILVDMDDTIEQLLKAWVAGINKKFGTHVSTDEIVSWNVAAAFPDLTIEQVYGIPMEPGFWKSVEPMPDAADVLKELITKGHEVYIVTATPPESIYEKAQEVLFKYFPFITWDHVIVTSHKQMILGDILIDDGIHNLEGGTYRKILMTAPHNKTYDAEQHGMIRVNNWKDITQVIEQVEQEM